MKEKKRNKRKQKPAMKKTYEKDTWLFLLEGNDTELLQSYFQNREEREEEQGKCILLGVALGSQRDLAK